MLVSEVVAAIQQRSPNYLYPNALLREITQVRDRLLRTPGAGQQQSDVIVTVYDLEAERTVYPLPAPASAIVDVSLKDNRYADYSDNVDRSDNGWYTLPRRQYGEDEGSRPYFYVTGGFIGLSRKPIVSTAGAMKIFHYPVLLPLTTAALAEDTYTGIDPNFDMLLVYGVLREITTGAEANEFSAKYQEIYTQYQSATNGFETYRVKRRWRL